MLKGTGGAEKKSAELSQLTIRLLLLARRSSQLKLWSDLHICKATLRE